MDTIFPSTKTGSLSDCSGRVINSKRWSETHVSVATGFISNGERSSLPTRVSTSVEEKHEFWVETSDRRQHQYSLPIPVTDGQILCLLWGRIGNTTALLYWHNLTSGRHALFDDLDKAFLLSPLGVRRGRRGFLWTIVVTIAVVAVTLAMSSDGPQSNPQGVIAFGVILGPIVGLIVRAVRRRAEAESNRPTLLQLCERASLQLTRHSTIAG